MARPKPDLRTWRYWQDYGIQRTGEWIAMEEGVCPGCQASDSFEHAPCRDPRTGREGTVFRCVDCDICMLVSETN